MKIIIFILFSYVCSYPQNTLINILFDDSFKESDIAGLLANLDASDLSTSVKDANNKITTWGDIENNEDATQADTSKSPTYSATSFNTSYPGLTFVTNDYLSWTNTIRDTTKVTSDFTVVVVVELNNDNASQQIISRFTASADRLMMGVDGVGTDQFCIKKYNGSAYAQKSKLGSADTNPHIVFFMLEATSLDMYVDVTQGADTDALLVNTPAAVGCTIGARHVNLDEYLNGVIAQILVYDTKLSASDRANLYSFLKNKWGLP